jgi:hypothetical protein
MIADPATYVSARPQLGKPVCRIMLTASAPSLLGASTHARDPAGPASRGYFQIHPDESKDRGFQHQRLSTDPDYSVQAGIDNVRYYARLARQRFPSIPVGSELYWRVVKLQHAMGSGLARRLLNGMRASNIPLTWETIKQYEVTDGPRLHRLLNPPNAAERGRFGRNVDKVFVLGRQLATALRR